MITSYDTLPVGKYEQLLKYRDTENADLEIIAILSGKTVDELLNMRLPEYAELRDHAGFLFYTPEPAKVRKTYSLGGMTLVPSDWQHLTTAQYIDFKEFQNAEPTMAQLLSVLMVPEGMEYGEKYDVMEVARLINDEMPVTEAAGLRNFFTERLVDSMRDSLTYSRRIANRLTDRTQRRELKKRIRETRSRLNGAGFVKWMRSASLPAVLGPQSIR